jgi:(p)ppGpp synthase/HD superfamily hydrolase
VFTDRFAEALAYAAEAHRTQLRKGSNVPYIGHLLGVAALVIEEGGDEDQAIAALLHDAAEDQGGLPRLEEIRQRFGERVAAIVEGCTDATEIPKPPWRGRKEKYVEHLATAPADTLMVSLADKLYNARSILMDYMRVGPAVWERFGKGAEAQLWYYRELADAFKKAGDQVPRMLATELDRVVTEIERLHAESTAAAARAG